VTIEGGVPEPASGGLLSKLWPAAQAAEQRGEHADKALWIIAIERCGEVAQLAPSEHPIVIFEVNECYGI
jgi:hypothetical protein